MTEQQTPSAKRKIPDNPDDHVILLTDGVQIPASRSCLSNVSDYFSAMFLSGMAESKKESIEVKVGKDLLQLLVDFSYSGKIEILKETAEELLIASVYLQFPKVVTECCHFLKDNVKAENCIRIENLASTHFLCDLKQAAHSFALANFMDLSRTEDFLQLNPDHLKEFLNSDIVMVDSEDDIFEALVSWFDSNEAAKYVEEDLVKTVRFPFLSSTLISKAVENPHFESAVATLQRLKDGVAEKDCRPRKTTAGILMAVGLDGEHIWDEYNPVEDVWMKAGSATACGEGGRYALADGVLYYAGGVTYSNNQSDFRYLDISYEKWFFGPKLLMARNNHGAAWLKGALYVVGGQDNHIENVLDLVEQWRPDSNKWQNVATLPFPIGFSGLTVLFDKMYVLGGNDAYYSTLNSAYCFDPHRNAWTECAPMKFARSEVGVGVLEGAVYAVGGNTAGHRSSNFERYDPRRDKWETLPEMLTPRSEPAVASLAGEVYVVGGNTKERRVQTVEIYDPSAGKWRTGSPLQSCPEDIQIFHLPRKASFFRNNIL